MAAAAAGLVAVHAGTAWVAVRPGRLDLWHALVFPRSAAHRIAVGGQFSPLLWDEPWRLFTSVLLHTDLLHLTLNTTSLLALGSVLEPALGRLRFWSVFCAGGLLGSVVPWAVGVRQSDGASGALFGLLGAGLAFGWRRRASLDADDRRLFGPVFLALTLVNLFGGLLVPAIDVTAHAGGLAAGLVFGALPETPAVERAEALGIGGFLGAVLFGAWQLAR